MLLFFPGNVHMIQTANTTQVATWVYGGSNEIEAAVGHGYPIIGENRDSFRWRLGIDGGAFMGFQPGGTLTFHLMTIDGSFGVPIDFQYADWVFRGEWRHDSAHFGDGIRYLKNRPPINALDTYSRESLGLFVGYDLRWLQPQFGGKWVYHVLDRNPYFILQGGAVLGEFSQSWSPYLAIYAQSSLGIEGSSRFVGQLGMSTSQKQSFKVSIQAVVGANDAGRLESQQEQKIGLWIHFDPEARMK